MSCSHDGPRSPRFRTLSLPAEYTWERVAEHPALPGSMRAALDDALRGENTAWGIPFEADHPLAVADGELLAVTLPAATARWVVFMHTLSLWQEPERGPEYLPGYRHGMGGLDQPAGSYSLIYADGTRATLELRRRHQIGAHNRSWGESCFQAVAAHKPMTLPAAQEQKGADWGWSQTRVEQPDIRPWTNWLYAWENPHPERAIVRLELCAAPATMLVLSGIAAGDVTEHPLRWGTRRKALLTLPEGVKLDRHIDKDGLLEQIQLDLGQVISAVPRLYYPKDWEASSANQQAKAAANQAVVEYTAHPEAHFHLWNGALVSAASLEGDEAGEALAPITRTSQRVRILVTEKGSAKPVSVRLHVHGEAGEYLAPYDRHRLLNDAWFEDYAPEWRNLGMNTATYIDGETDIELPLGRVYLEISKGFEIRPLRITREITPETRELHITLERVLDWRARGWVTADTHVHFLSPMTAMLEGAAEGVNVVNLLSSQWGELMTNAGDFDGKNTWGSREAGGDGEWLVRVGSENRQHVLGHISLLGYNGRPIVPWTRGGPDESALGDPVDVLLSEWAAQCRAQGGLVVLPHFPNPRAEHAAAIVEGQVDAIEMTSWADSYFGLNPYSLTDWYRYLNCDMLLPAVGGTDKMAATTAVGTVRTYARLAPGQLLSYEAWMNAVRRAETFVSYGPLLEFSVSGTPMGSRLVLPYGGGHLEVHWEARSVTHPMTRAELIVNGEIRESVAIDPWQASGSWSWHVPASAWCALLLRAQPTGRPEIIAAHSSPVMAMVEGSDLVSAADLASILAQIEGALAYLDTVGTRAEDHRYRQMRLALEGSARKLHNRLHQAGWYHEHPTTPDHGGHQG
ncbi:MAG: CehA/McbA family metallohydrolase [Chloroflexi bacterium]|nr:CehA/McbA family metallohydrolase [Chloroflexota bacterium]